MEISTAMMQHILRLTEGYTDLLNELKEVKAELAELKGEKPKKPTIHETKYPHMSIITRKSKMAYTKSSCKAVSQSQKNLRKA